MPNTPTELSTSAKRALADFVVQHRAEGLRAALATILMKTDYRFIGIWRFQDGKADAAVHFDRENPTVLRADEVPDNATYCCFVRERGAPFKTPNALVDQRLVDHPARSAVLAYCGVPLMDLSGNIIGTLCHYDIVPRNAEQIDVALMMSIASYLALGGHVPPYPSA